jgi:diguanylate cyclase (GGDEF)-like protein
MALPIRRLVVLACVFLGMAAVWWSHEALRSTADIGHREAAAARDLQIAMTDQALSLLTYKLTGHPAALERHERDMAALQQELARAVDRPGWGADAEELVRRQAELFESWQAATGVGEPASRSIEAGPFLRGIAIFSEYRRVNQELVDQLDATRRADQRRTSAIGVGVVWGVLLVGLIAFLLVDVRARRQERLQDALNRLAERVQRARTEEDAHQVLREELNQLLPGTQVHVLDPGTPTQGMRFPAIAGGEEVAVLAVGSLDDPSDRQALVLAQAAARCAPTFATLRTLAEAEHRASTDQLTGLPNPSATHDALARLVAASQRSGRPLAVALLDIDHFKRVNDRFGHAKGDEVLAAAGRAVAGATRASDVAGRVGGEEFLILMPDTDADGAREVAERVRAALEALEIDGIEHGVTGSLGVALHPRDAIEGAELVRRADQAMYAAKDAGRNRVVLASGEPVSAA